MRTIARIAVLVVAMSGLAGLVETASAASDGMIAKQSPHSVDATAQRLEDAAKAKGLAVFPRIDHAQAARDVGLEMPPTVVVSFGNPKYGTPLMVENPQAGIDFPPRAIVYEDSAGQVWIAYNSADYFYGTLFERHGLSYTEKEVAGLTALLDGLSDAAVKANP